jgi:hypothetical protein
MTRWRDTLDPLAGQAHRPADASDQSQKTGRCPTCAAGKKTKVRSRESGAVRKVTEVESTQGVLARWSIENRFPGSLLPW